jgi:hypothetical protein
MMLTNPMNNSENIKLIRKNFGVTPVFVNKPPFSDVRKQQKQNKIRVDALAMQP